MEAHPIFVGIISSLVGLCTLTVVLDKDYRPKIGLMAFAVSLLYFINSQHKTSVDYFIWLATTGSFWYVVTLGVAVKTSDAYGTKLSSNNQNQRRIIYRSQCIIVVTIGIVIFMAVHCLSHPLFFPKLTSPVFISGVGLVVLSLFALGVVDRLVIFYAQSEILRRKLFHVGPILIVPLLHQFDAQLLVLILNVGFFLFFMLQMIRYALSQMQKAQKHTEFISLNQTSIKKYLKSIYDLIAWMESFNQQRQPHFWFTHLFLILSLALSYNISLIFGDSQVSPHIVLCLIGADMMAALVGKHFGSIRIYGRKTMEGTAAFALTMIISSSALISYKNQQAMSLSQIVCQFVAAILCAVTQQFSGDADNIATLFCYYLVFFAFSSCL